MTKSALLALSLGVLVALILAPTTALADTIHVSRVAYDAANPGATIETWDDNPAGTTIANGGILDGVEYSSSTGISIVTSSFLTTIGANGLGRTPIEFFQAGDTITFSFAAGIDSWGIDINTFATNFGAYKATTNTGVVASSSFDPFPGRSTGQFIGFNTDK